MDGVLNINKPAGMTSHDVVDQLRRILHEKKVGHTGTLDPDATGVLPVCLGKATKIIQFLQDEEKGYEGTMTLGIVTDTLDASGRVLGISDSSYVQWDDVKNVFSRFVGEIEQIPPMVSAVKVQGERLYKMARQGKTVSRPSRRIYIYDLELLDLRRSMLKPELPSIQDRVSITELDFRVRCSRGTYVRSIAADIGDVLGCGAHLSRLVRTKSGIFKLEDSIGLEEFRADPQRVIQAIRSMDEVLCFMPVMVITDSARRRFLNGVSVKRGEVVRSEGEFRVDEGLRVHDEAGMLLGIGKFVDAHSPETERPSDTICKAVKVLGKI